MNCDECQEHVFDLIERERTEPETVREILDRCPECRSLFAEMKAALADASLLPLEEPPREIDQLILDAARKRTAERAMRPRPWYRSTPWAVAATAVLAIGVGVWSIPRSEPVAMEDAAVGHATEAREDDRSLAPEGGEQVHAEEEIAGTTTDVALAAEPAAEPASDAERPETRQKKSARAPSVARVAASAPAERGSELAGAAAPTSAGRLELASADAADEESMGNERRRPSPECEARLAELEDGGMKGSDEETTPEDALAIGRCYRARGDVREARRWLERAASDPKTRDPAMRLLKALPTR